MSPSLVSGHSCHFRAHSGWSQRGSCAPGWQNHQTLLYYSFWTTIAHPVSLLLGTDLLEGSSRSDLSWCPQSPPQETAEQSPDPDIPEGPELIRKAGLPSPESTERSLGQPFCGLKALLLSKNTDSRAGYLASLMTLMCFHSFSCSVASAWKASYKCRINCSLF